MLLDLFKEKKCFKFILGAGNEDVFEVEKLVCIYSLAGANFFDICAKKEVIQAAKKGLKRAGSLKNRFLCISVGVKDDPHVSKASINGNCIKCGTCKDLCPQNAIKNGEINSARCIGCGRCAEVCPKCCIEIKSEVKDFSSFLPPLIEEGIDSIEFHVQTEAEEEIFKKWKELNLLFKGPLGVCFDRKKLGDEKLILRAKKMLSKRAPYSTIIQADGVSMSGGKDTFNSTLQAVATADLFLKQGFEAYVILSGGVNSKTTELAKLCDVPISGVAMGSYARKIVIDLISRDDFFENKEIFKSAVLRAEKLVKNSLKFLG